MIEALKALAALLARDPVTAAEVVLHLGTVKTDYGTNVRIVPRSDLFQEANVVREINPETYEPMDVPRNVHLTPGQPVTLKQLSAAFGPYQEVPSLDEHDREVLFHLDMPGQPRPVALIARLKGRRCVELTLRRDIRLT